MRAGGRSIGSGVSFRVQTVSACSWTTGDKQCRMGTVRNGTCAWHNWMLERRRVTQLPVDFDEWLEQERTSFGSYSGFPWHGPANELWKAVLGEADPPRKEVAQEEDILRAAASPRQHRDAHTLVDELLAGRVALCDAVTVLHESFATTNAKLRARIAEEKAARPCRVPGPYRRMLDEVMAEAGQKARRVPAREPITREPGEDGDG